METIKEAQDMFGSALLKIVAVYERCRDDPRECKRIIEKFKKAGVLPRGLLYKAIIEKDHELANIIQDTFKEEIAAALVRYISSGGMEVNKDQIEAELRIWEQIFEEA